MIQDTPEQFITQTNHVYPPHNEMIFEEYFYGRFYEENIYTDRIYLPILWTNYYISKNYCNDDMSDLQDFLNSLSRAERYFTVVQWDDGIVNDISDLDIFSFASGGVGSYPIPLINQLPPIDGMKVQKDIMCSFIGCISGRHRIREKMKRFYLREYNLRRLFRNHAEVSFCFMPKRIWQNFLQDKRSSTMHGCSSLYI